MTVWAAVIALAFASQEARAPVEMIYERGSGAASCPSQLEFERSVADWLGYWPFASSAERRIAIGIRRDGGQLRADLSVESEAEEFLGRRTFTQVDNDCRALSRAMVMTLGLIIDPQSLGPVMVEKRPLVRPRTVMKSSEGKVSQVVSRPVSRVSLLAGPAGTFGSTSAVAWGGRLGVRILWVHFALETDLQADLPTTVVGSTGDSLSTALVLGSLLGCWQEPWKSVRLGLCGGASGGVQLSSGVGLANSETKENPYFGIGVRTSIEAPLNRVWAVRASVEALAPLSRISLYVGLPQPAVAWTTPPLQISFALDLIFGL